MKIIFFKGKFEKTVFIALMISALAASGQISEPSRKGYSKSGFLEMIMDSLQVSERESDTVNVIRFAAVLTTNLHGTKAREQAQFYVDLAYRYAQAYSGRNFVPDICNRYGMLYFAFAKHYKDRDWDLALSNLDSSMYWHGRAIVEGNPVTRGWGHRGILSGYLRKREFGLGDFQDQIENHYQQIMSLLEQFDDPQLFDHASGLYTKFLLDTDRLAEARILLDEIAKNAELTELRNEFSYYKNLHHFIAKSHGLDTLIALSELGMSFYEARIIAAHEESFHEMDQKYKVSKTSEQLEVTNDLLNESNFRVLLLALILIVFTGVLIILLILYRRNKRLSIRNSLLLREQNHRVKNNLQMISSLLSLQSQKLLSTDAKEALSDSQSRVNSVALLHRMLYEGENIGKVNLKEYLQSLIDEITYAVNREITYQIRIDDVVNLPVEKATSLGLIVNELLTNSVKHIPDATAMEVHLSLSMKRNVLILEYGDNGPGVSADVWERSASFGNQLVRIQSNQLRGTYSIESDAGFRYRLSLPA
ncbi:sensor histidine kinase [Marinoscillum sp.]|uniref:sensor histidine kinase n=1 Tax=Marinoscillum sp. TaxID=2024838 RepID=UPI003BAAC07B